MGDKDVSSDPNVSIEQKDVSSDHNISIDQAKSSDQAMIDNLTSSFEEDLQDVLERYQDLVYRIALTHTRSIHDAQDVFQEVFVIYWRKQPVSHSENHRQAWIITTTRNCARHITSGSWRKKVVLFDHAQNLTPDNQPFQFDTDEQNQVFQVLQNLPDPYRTVLHLFYFEDMSVAQIADSLRIRAGTVKVQLSRGRKMMREQLKGAYFDER